MEERNNLYFKSIAEFELFKSYLSIIGFGSESTCYKLNGRVLKYLDGPSYTSEYTKEDILRYEGFNNPDFSFIFGDGILYINDMIYGYLMTLARGVRISDYDCNHMGFSELNTILTKVGDDIKLLSNNGVLMDDIFSTNVIYNKNCFKIIDTINYTNSNKKKELVLRNNMVNFSNNILDYILSDIIIKFVKNNINLRDWYKSKEMMYNPHEFINDLLNTLNSNSPSEIITIGDAKKRIKSYKKNTNI